MNSKIPYWQNRSIAFSSDNKIHRQVYVKELSVDSVLLQISKSLSQDKDYEKACLKLVDVGLNDQIVREMFDQYLVKTSYKFIIDMLVKVDVTQNEALMLLESVWKENNIEAAEKIRDDKLILGYVPKDSLIKELYDKVCSILS